MGDRPAHLAPSTLTTVWQLLPCTHLLLADAATPEEPFCLSWNMPSVCFFETVYPLLTDETFQDFYQYNIPFGT